MAIIRRLIRWEVENLFFRFGELFLSVWNLFYRCRFRALNPGARVLYLGAPGSLPGGPGFNVPSPGLDVPAMLLVSVGKKDLARWEKDPQVCTLARLG